MHIYDAGAPQGSALLQEEEETEEETEEEIEEEIEEEEVQPQIDTVGSGINCGSTKWLGARSVGACRETCLGQGYTRFKHASGVNGNANGRPGSDNNCACC